MGLALTLLLLIAGYTAVTHRASSNHFRENRSAASSTLHDFKVAATDPATAPSSSSSLEISGLQFRGMNGDNAKFSYDLLWDGTTFPGVRQCTWQAFDSKGEPVGSFTDSVLAMTPKYSDMPVSIPVSAEPTTASGSCSETRMDAGSPYAYEFADVHPVQDPKRPDEVRVFFGAKWLGSAAPGPVSCTFDLIASSGELIYQAQGDVYLMEDPPAEVSFMIRADELATETPTDANMSCVPFTG
jgi:hypothetical protein